MSASTHLAKFGLSVDQAREFILANYQENLGLIYNAAKQFGVTNEMLAEIVQVGFTGADISAYFSAHGFSGVQLDAQPLLGAQDVGLFASLIALNTSSGVLSTASLRAQVISQTSDAAYQFAFNPDHFQGSADGWFTSEELGLPLGPLPATTETLESLFYGTVIQVAYRFDSSEVDEFDAFLTPQNRAGIENDDAAVIEVALALFASILEDPASPPALADSEIAEIAVDSARMLVQLAGQWSEFTLFDELLTGFL